MAKKKELPKAMSGGIKPLIRAVVSTGKVAGKSTVRSGKAFYNAVGYAPTIKGPVSLVKAGAKGIKAGAKGFTRGVKSEIKTEKAKANAIKQKAIKDQSLIPITEDDIITSTSNVKRTKKDWMNSGTPKPAPKPKPKPATPQKTIADKKPVKKPMSKRKKIAIVGGTGAAIAGIKYATREKRTLKD